MYEDRAREMFEGASPYEGVALEYHNRRLMEFALAIARQERVDVDEDLMRTGCWLHDYGLFVQKDGEPSYLKRSWRAVEPVAREWGMGERALAEIKDMLLYNHGMRRVKGIRPMGDLVRRAVHVEHSLGGFSEGLRHGTVHRVFEKYPRSGLTTVLVDFARITIVQDGTLQLWPMFFPRYLD
jgi:hypothetical protein